MFLSWIAAIGGLVAAWLWWKGTRVEVPAPPETDGVGALMGGYLISVNAKGERYDLHETLKQQSKWNGRAARASAIVAVIAGVGWIAGAYGL